MGLATMTNVTTTSSADAPPPLVSIGLPVFNGANYVAAAIESVLAQTVRDLELIIFDNASTDSTQSICQDFAARDPRVRYHRNPENVGAGPNYDLCFHASRGTYFKWTAHDDLLSADFLEKTIAALEAAPRAVLCCVGVREIGPEGEVIREYESPIGAVGDRRPSDRFAALILDIHNVTDFFGLFRRDALVGSQLHGTYRGCDLVLLAEMALRGPFVAVDDPVFLHREHDARYTRAVFHDRAAASAWLAASAARVSDMQFSAAYKKLFRVATTNTDGLGERLRCYRHLLHWLFIGYNGRRLMNDQLWSMSPKLQRTLQSAKRAVFGVSPGAHHGRSAGRERA